MKNQESCGGVEAISLSILRPRAISNLIKPLSIKHLTTSNIFQKKFQTQDMNLVCCQNQDNERTLLETEETEKHHPDETLKKLTKFRLRKRSLDKDLIRTKSWFLASLQLLWERIVGFLSSILFGISIFFQDIASFFTSILLSITKFFLLIMTKIIMWRELKWPTEAVIRERKKSINNLFMKRWKKIQRFGVKPLTLVIDLDETLIHSSNVKKPGLAEDPLLIIQNDGTYRQIYLRKRPHLNYFLEKLSQEYNLVIFTAARIEYADPILDSIDQNSYISKRLYRESCIRVGQGWIKDIAKVGSKLTDTLLLDNCPVAGNLSPDNHILIKPWFDDEKDEELLKYTNALLEYANQWKTSLVEQAARDIREFVKRDFVGKLKF